MKKSFCNKRSFQTVKLNIASLHCGTNASNTCKALNSSTGKSKILCYDIATVIVVTFSQSAQRHPHSINIKNIFNFCM